MRISYILIISLSVIVLASCASTNDDTARNERKQRVEQAFIKYKSETDKCETIKDSQAKRMECWSNAFSIIRPYKKYADLYDLRNQTEIQIAQRFDKGEIDYLEANRLSAEMKSKIASEIHRRDNADRLADAQEEAAFNQFVAAGRPITCNKFYDTVSCY